MKRQILFVQGAGEGTYDHWDNKLVRSLEAHLGPQFEVCYPRMPGEEHPSYPTWRTELYNEFGRLDDGAVLIGHSVGGTFLIHAVAESTEKRKWGALVLIAAPFVGDGGWSSDDDSLKADLTKLLDVPVFVYHGAADSEVPPTHSELYAQQISHATLRILPDRDHQLGNDLSEVADDIRRLIAVAQK